MMPTLNIWDARDRNAPALVGTLSIDMTGEMRFSYADDWRDFPLSPALPLSGALPISAVSNFVQNLLPEGDQLEAVSRALSISKASIFGLIAVIGKESAGALSFLPEGVELSRDEVLAEVTHEDIHRKIEARGRIPFGVWDGKVRQSIAGYQEKTALLVRDGRYFLADGAAASTHILKPIPGREGLEMLVANEHYCMALAKAVGLPTASAQILRVPEPCLLVARFDRDAIGNRMHAIDGCQALGLPPSFKYERPFGHGRDVKHIDSGVSIKRLASLKAEASIPAQFEQQLLSWFAFQHFIGNSDAHGKNISFLLEKDGRLRVAPAYDLTSSVMFDDIADDMAMGVSSDYSIEAKAFQWGELAWSLGLKRPALASIITKVSVGVQRHAERLAESVDYEGGEREHVRKIAEFALERTSHMKEVCEGLRHHLRDEDFVDSKELIP